MRRAEGRRGRAKYRYSPVPCVGILSSRPAVTCNTPLSSDLFGCGPWPGSPCQLFDQATELALLAILTTLAFIVG